MNIYGFSEVNKDEVLNVYNLDFLKKEFRDESEKLVKVYETDEFIRARRSREPSPKEVTELLNLNEF